MQSPFAHGHGQNKSSWQTLADHLTNTATTASAFAKVFGSSEYAYLIGALHDIGKARLAFQSYLRRCNGVEDDEPDFGDHAHSCAGACWLAQHGNGIGKALAYCVAGHHAGLPDWPDGVHPRGVLSTILKEDAPVFGVARSQMACVKNIGNLGMKYNDVVQIIKVRKGCGAE